VIPAAAPGEISVIDGRRARGPDARTHHARSMRRPRRRRAVGRGGWTNERRARGTNGFIDPNTPANTGVGGRGREPTEDR
jgi:hypothetical protein